MTTERRGRRAAWRAAVAVAACAATALLQVPPAHAEHDRTLVAPPGTVEVPPHESDRPLSITPFSVNAAEQGVAFTAGRRQHVVLAGSTTLRSAAGHGDERTWLAPGTVVQGFPTGSSRLQDVRLTDTRSGAQTTLQTNGAVLGALAGGAWIRKGGSGGGEEVRVLTAEGERLLAAVPGFDFEYFAHPTGVLVLSRGSGESTLRLVEPDGTVRVLAQEQGRLVSPRLSPDHAGYVRQVGPANDEIVVLRRHGTVSAQVRRVELVDAFALRDDGVAWRRAFRDEHYVAPLDASAPRTLVDATAVALAPASGPGGFVFTSFGDSTSRGRVLLLRTGQTRPELLVEAPLAPSPVLDLRLDQDRFVVADEALGADVAVRAVERSGRTVTVGSEQRVTAPPRALEQRLSGRYRAVLLRLDDGSLQVAVDEQGAPLLRVPARSDLESFELSGPRLLLTSFDERTGKGSARVVDARNGSSHDFPYGAALWGPYVAYVEAGRVLRRDLDRDEPPLVLREATPLADCACLPTANDTFLQISRDTVLAQALHERGARDLLFEVTQTGVRRRDTASDLATTLLLDQELLVTQREGFYADDVHTSLGVCPAADVISVTCNGFGIPDLLAFESLVAVDDETVAWEALDGWPRLTPLPDAMRSPARVLSLSASPVLARGAAAWTLRVDADEPLQSWRLVVTDSAGRTVHEATGQAPDGAVRASWDGRRPDGTAVPDGDYSWTLTGSDDGQPLLAADGGRVTGAVAVRAGASAASRLVPLDPQRVLDTRSGLGARRGTVPAKGSVVLDVLGRGGVPETGPTTVLLNVTLTQAAAGGFVQVLPTGAAQPGAYSNINVSSRGQTVAGLVTAPIGRDGTVTLYSSGGGHLLADVFGYYEPVTSSRAGRYVPLTPTRLLDTRAGDAGKPAAGDTVDVQVAGRAAVPASGVAAVALNVTATQASRAGFVQALPSGGSTPVGASSNLNVSAAGQTIANQVVVPVGSDGKVRLHTSAGTHLLADVVGYYTDTQAAESASGLFHALTPARLVDTRSDGGRPADEGELVLSPLGRRGVPPSGTSGIVLNVTAVNSSGGGFVQVYPTGRAAPGSSSTLNVGGRGQVIANSASASLGDGGRISLYASRSTDLLVDVFGFFAR